MQKPLQSSPQPPPKPFGTPAVPVVHPDGAAKPRPPRSWFTTHGRDLRFLILFGLLMLTYYAVSTTDTMKHRFFPWYLERNADAAVGAFHVAGLDWVNRNGKQLVSKKGSITVERGCDAVDPTALFVAGVLASPVAFGTKVPAVLVGTLILAVVNLIRIITLFLSAVYWRAAFDILHLDVWQAAFVFLAILLWAFWAAWAGKRPKRPARA